MAQINLQRSHGLVVQSAIPQPAYECLPWQNLDTGFQRSGLPFERNNNRAFHAMFLSESPQAAHVALVDPPRAFDFNGHIEIAENEVHFLS
jgi:hypothetical protein